MERDLFPLIGGFPVGEINEGLRLSALKPIEKRGAIKTAHRLRQRAERVFRYAAGAGSPNANPAVNVRHSLAPTLPKRRWPALVEMKDIRELVRDVDTAGALPSVKLPSRFLALTAQRPGMVRHCEWDQIEGVDWDTVAPAPDATWRVPAGSDETGGRFGGACVHGWAIWDLPGFHVCAERHALWRVDGRHVVRQLRSEHKPAALCP